LIRTLLREVDRQHRRASARPGEGLGKLLETHREIIALSAIGLGECHVDRCERVGSRAGQHRFDAVRPFGERRIVAAHRLGNRGCVLSGTANKLRQRRRRCRELLDRAMLLDQ
jgi:hypothetical protein